VKGPRNAGPGVTARLAPLIGQLSNSG